VRSGPKAANLGQLKQYFPEKVAPGIVIPFGVYQAHVTRSSAGGRSLFDRIRECFEEARRMRSSGASSAKVRAFVFPQLADFRKQIREMTLEPWFIDALNEKMREVFGADDTYGVFIRSDTNAEDLPKFSGAGLNLTVPNVVGTEKILQGIKDVWASPFEERAYEWRAQALVASYEVYPSVVLVQTVGSDKSGVMATANLETLATDEITVNVNEGIAAVVDGGVAESLLLKPNGTVTLLAQARSPYKKAVDPRGGLMQVPTSGSDYVLTEDELRQLRELAQDVEARFPPAVDADGGRLPWDIEFGFLDGQLRLFQIRPLVRYQETRILEALAEFEASRPEQRPVRLDEVLEPE
jgi:phosphoenolpyruvate synthase/pyruvate phosphate dikinase